LLEDIDELMEIGEARPADRVAAYDRPDAVPAGTGGNAVRRLYGLAAKPAFAWALLVAAQTVGGALVLAEFLSGDKHFAYLDIGSDTWSYFLPQAMHLADYLRGEGWPGWSFSIGLGAPMFPAWDPFVWPYLAVGSENVLAARVWVFAAKLLLAGWAFFALLRRLDVTPPAATVAALAYTFCGYALVNAQWDPFAAELVFYPLLLWAALDRLHGGAAWKLALAVAAAIAANVFVVSLCVFLVWAFAGATLLARQPLAAARAWIVQVAPPVAGGLLLAAPVLLPLAFQLLDSPRVSGTQALFAERLGAILTPANGEQWLSLIAGFFHKDLLHVGSAHQGWWNYLETPGFYVGMPALLLLPQLWRGTPRERRALFAGLGCVLLYCALPALAHAAFAFAVPYYRTSNLWIGMLLLLLAARALDRVLREGIDPRLLALGGVLLLALPLALWAVAGERVWTAHLGRIVALTLAALTLLALAAWRGWHGDRAAPLALCLLALVAVEAVLVGRPSFHHGRETATRQGATYADWSQRAVEALRRGDDGFYRIEKQIGGFLNDALAQRYFGISSYHAYNGSSSVRLNTALGLLPERGEAVNYTNWLFAPGDRFALYSLLGVRYLIAAVHPGWPGFVLQGRVGPLAVLRNEAALPLAVVHHRQIAFADFVAAPPWVRDFAMFHALVADEPLPGLPVLTMDSLGRPTADRLGELYFAPAAALQRGGLAIESFSHNRVVGTVATAADGVLVFSIPFGRGWQASVDGRAVALFRANLGMSALALPAGTHRVELTYRVPGLAAGLWLAALAALALAAAAVGIRRAGRATGERCTSRPAA
jgi:hypothetical protein